MTNSPDFALLHPDGRLEYKHRAGTSMNAAIRNHIVHHATQGMGRLRAWFPDNFGGLPPNALAERVMAAIGYRGRPGWRGVVAVSMEEDSSGDCPPLTPEVRATLDELAAS